MPVRTCLLALFVVVSLLPGCARGARSGRDAKLDRSPAAQLDWLPASSVAVAHVDMAAVRDTSWYPLLEAELPEAVAEGLANTRAARFAFEPTSAGGSMSEDLWMSIVLDGDYDEPPTTWLAANDRTSESTAKGKKLYRTPSFTCFETPEAFWVCTEPALVSQLLVPPASRNAQLSHGGWAHAPETGAYVAVQAEVPAELRTKMLASLNAGESNPGRAMFGQTLAALRDVSVSVGPERRGLSLRAELGFDSEDAAQSALGLLAIVRTAMLSSNETQNAPPELRKLIQDTELALRGASVTISAWIDEATTRKLTNSFVRGLVSDEDDEGDGQPDADGNASTGTEL